MWFEELPKECPPANAVEPNGVYYRFVSSETITDDDFISLKMLKPDKNHWPKECQARALSLTKDIASSVEMIKKLPQFKTKRLAQVQLGPDDGLILNTPSSNNKNHISWWRSRSFNLNQSSVIA
jgi:hypothetical protein